MKQCQHWAGPCLPCLLRKAGNANAEGPLSGSGWVTPVEGTGGRREGEDEGSQGTVPSVSLLWTASCSSWQWPALLHSRRCVTAPPPMVPARSMLHQHAPATAPASGSVPPRRMVMSSCLDHLCVYLSISFGFPDLPIPT